MTCIVGLIHDGGVIVGADPHAATLADWVDAPLSGER